MRRVSRKFVEAIRNAEEPQYAISWRGGVDPTVLSALVRGAKRVYPADERVIAVGKVLGLAASDCFETDQEVSA